MFKKTRILHLLATSALLAACGGGTSSTTGVAAAGTNGTVPVAAGTPPAGDSANATTSATTSTPAAGTGSSTPSVTGGTGTSSAPPANSTGSNTGTSSAGTGTGSTTPASPPTPVPPAPVAVDQKLNGYLQLVANQIVYVRTNRVIYLPNLLTQFESDTGIVDVASGSKTPPPLNIDVVSAHCNPDIDGTCGVQPSAAAPAAPIAVFGFRIGKSVVPSSPDQVVGNQTVTGRIAIDLTERNDSPDVGTNEVAEIMRFVIDKVKISTDKNGEIVSAKLDDGAQIHVYGRNGKGVEARADIPAPPETVRLMPITDGPDSKGDTTSVYLLLDLEAGFSQAGQKLSALENIAGHFSMHVTLSSVQQIVRLAIPAPDSGPAVAEKNLVGDPITVNDQPPVTGAGISGNAWIRMYP